MPPHAPSNSRPEPPDPPDRSRVLTEQRNPRSMRLHEMSVSQITRLIHEEDRSVASAVEQALPRIDALIQDAEPGWLRGGRLVYLGAGTSGRLGVLDASECPPTFSTPPERVVGIIAGGDGALRRSSEGAEDDPLGAVPALRALSLSGDDCVIGIAAGGTTPYVLGALEWVKKQTDARTALLCCAPVHEAPAFVDHLLCAPTGPEVVTGSTRMKAGTATKLVLNTISTTLMIREGRVRENLMIELRATNDKLRDRCARVLMTLTGLDRARALELLDDSGGSVRRALERFGPR